VKLNEIKLSGMAIIVLTVFSARNIHVSRIDT
jgi:hypothetical protein